LQAFTTLPEVDYIALTLPQGEKPPAYLYPTFAELKRSPIAAPGSVQGDAEFDGSIMVNFNYMNFASAI
jgi:hypothetical protein